MGEGQAILHNLFETRQLYSSYVISTVTYNIYAFKSLSLPPGATEYLVLDLILGVTHLEYLKRVTGCSKVYRDFTWPLHKKVAKFYSNWPRRPPLISHIGLIIALDVSLLEQQALQTYGKMEL